MEIGLTAEVPTYSGGLGVLAGDTIRAAADLRVPMVAVTLLHRRGYCTQRLDESGRQVEEPVNWSVAEYLRELPARASVSVEGRTVHLRAWKFEVAGAGGYTVPVYFLDTNLPENNEADRNLSGHLYGGDSHYRLAQETVLGIGGVRMLRALGQDQIRRFHMNEGHASLLVLELLSEVLRKSGRSDISDDDIASVRKMCAFTTHTPVAAGHDKFAVDLVTRVLDAESVRQLKMLNCLDGTLNVTTLALRLSHYVNAVAKRHGEVSRQLFNPHPVDYVTNGIHAVTWAAPAFRELFDRHVPDWREDNLNLRNACKIPLHEIWQAHERAKTKLIEHVNRRTNVGMRADVFTIGFARRAATYKRAGLIFEDIERLKKIASDSGGLQLIFAGKAHPHDQEGKALIRRVFEARELLRDTVRTVYLENYDMELCRVMAPGVDLWLNNPQPPLEASGTSGMKAALNGVPSLSVIDGWWVEGWIEGVTGWSIGKDDWQRGQESDRWRDAAVIYDKLEYTILPMFYQQRERFAEVMRNSIALNGSYFNTHRMMQQYVVRAYT